MAPSKSFLVAQNRKSSVSGSGVFQVFKNLGVSERFICPLADRSGLPLRYLPIRCFLSELISFLKLQTEKADSFGNYWR